MECAGGGGLSDPFRPNWARLEDAPLAGAGATMSVPDPPLGARSSAPLGQTGHRHRHGGS
jgi:hypothetical protein